MKKGCAMSLVVWLACIALYAWLAWPKVREVAPTLMIGVLGGTFAAMLAGSIAGLFTGGNDRAALRRAAAGEPMRDGRLEAASGPIRPLGEPLEAPFTGRPCVAWEYDVKTPGSQKSDFAGVALTPSVVDGIRGPARLLGWAMLDQFSASGAERVDRARGAAYLQSTQFEKLGLTSVLSVFGELTADDDGSIRKDFRIDDPSPDLEGKRVEEKVVEAGQTVTVIGIWSEAKGGFSPAGRAAVNRIFPFGLEAATKKLASQPFKQLATALVFFLALHAILVPMYLLAPKYDRQGRKIPKNASVLDERDCERQKELLEAGADPNEKRDGMTPLMNAARYGLAPCVANLLAKGARLEEKDRNGDTAFAHALLAEQEETAAMLLSAGAKDFRVTEKTGRWQVTTESEPFLVVKEYLAAMQEGDLDALARLRPGSSRAELEERQEDLDTWRAARPASPDLVNGWMTDEAATLTVRGRSPDGGERVVSYHLEKGFEGWRIYREWFRP